MSHSAVILLSLGPALCTSGDPITTRSMVLGLRDGTVTSFADAHTGEQYHVESPLSLLGIRRPRNPDLIAPPPATITRSVEGSPIVTACWKDKEGESRLVTRWQAQSDGDVLVTQEATSSTPGLAGVQWGWAVPDSWEVLVPGHSGQRFGADSPYQTRRLEYPLEWEAQFVLIQGKRGGVLIFAEDVATRFKTLRIEHRPGEFLLGLETRCTAPFESLKTAESVRWRIHAYQGTWLRGAAAYRQWAERAFELTPLTGKQPAWIRDIQLVVLVDLKDVAVLKALAKHVTPAQTLLYVPGWRKAGYDYDYPDYTAIDGFDAQMKQARQMGYRIMLHVNYFGCTPENPAYKSLEPYHCLDPFTREKLYWDWPSATPPIKFAYINPAAKAWRSLFVRRMAELCRMYGPDALHLDQTLCMFNDAHGPIDGMNMMQGNIALHRELREALPDVALSGEGLNEITCRYEAFAQRHVYGINHTDGECNDSLIAMAHPVSSSLLADHTTLYGYLGMPNPEPTDYYYVWRTAYERFGVIPTYAWPRLKQVEDPPGVVRTLLAEAKWFQQSRPIPDWSPDGSPKTLFGYRTIDGKRAEYRRMSYGVSLVEAASPNAGTNERVVVRRISRVTSAQLPGQIPGWRAYDDQRLIGLDPKASYAYVDEPRDPNAMHICRLPEGAVVKRVGLRPQFVVIELDDLQGLVANLWEPPGKVRSGEALRDGTCHEVDSPVFRSDAGSQFEPTGETLHAHPPWRGEAVSTSGPARTSGLGYVWTEFEVTLPPDRPARFETRVGLREAIAAENSDGVTFRVSAEPKASAVARQTRLTTERHTRSSMPEPLTLDLAPLRGQAIRLRLESDPGAAGSVSFDWAVWVRPRIVLTTPRIEDVEIVCPRPMAGIISTPESQLPKHVADSRYAVSLPIPGKTTLLFTKPDTIRLPLDLLSAPFTDSLILKTGQEEEPTGFCCVQKAAATVGGVTKQAMMAHPPMQGQHHVDYLLALPAGPIRLTGYAGIRDGASSKANGVGFRITVDGREVWRTDMRPGEPWRAFEVTMTEYAGRTILLTLITDSLGDYGWDWAEWSEIRLAAIR